MSVAIEIDCLSKTVQAEPGGPAVQAVTCLRLSVPPGQVLGLLGHAGAGKTTVIQLIGGLLQPTTGRVIVNGYDTVRQRDAARQQVHVALTETNALSAHTRTIPAQPVLLFDEPALGLDPWAIKDRVKELAHEHARTVVLATRDLDVARELCDRVAVLSQGHLVADRDANFLADRFLGRPFYHIRVKGCLSDSWATWFDGLNLATEDNGEMVLSGPIVDQAALHGVLAKLRNLCMPLLSVTCNDLNLGDMFAHAAEGSGTDHR